MPLRWMTLLCACALAWTVDGWAQQPQPDLDDLQRQVDAEKARQQRAEAERQRAAAAAARQGSLVVRADADCALVVNGQDKGRLEAGKTTTVRVTPGEQLIECDAGSGRLAESTATVASGEQKVVRLEVPPPVRFVAVSDGIHDTQEGLVWASQDNGYDINWHDARRFCASKGGGWTLPAVAQLQRLYDSDPNGTRCGNFTCKVPPLFGLSNFAFWSSESNGSSEAFSVLLGNGDRHSLIVSNTNSTRALCVRRRS